MGSNFSGHSNDELIDHLVNERHIKSLFVERIFRVVDRGDFLPSDARDLAYRDEAWRSRTKNIHLSASCIYSEALELLDLRPGLSFLNIGSGTGYFSTLVGLALGPFGTNHGIEVHQDTVTYATECLDNFITNVLPKIVDFNFCAPSFTIGNILSVEIEMKYDRIYCGARCRAGYLGELKKYLNINGILVVPVGNRLVRIVRVSELEWEHETRILVSFASLILPNLGLGPVETLNLPMNPPTLQEICRSCVRNSFRDKIFKEHPELDYISSKTAKDEPESVRFFLVQAKPEDESVRKKNVVSFGMRPTREEIYENSNISDSSDDDEDLVLNNRRAISPYVMLMRRIDDSDSQSDNSDMVFNSSSASTASSNSTESGSERDETHVQCQMDIDGEATDNGNKEDTVKGATYLAYYQRYFNEKLSLLPLPDAIKKYIGYQKEV